MKQLFCSVVWQNRDGVQRTGVARMKFDKTDKVYTHPDIEHLVVPGSGLFVYNKQKNKLRIQQNEEYDWENEYVIFAADDTTSVQLFELGMGLGSHIQEYYQKHKSNIIIP